MGLLDPPAGLLLLPAAEAPCALEALRRGEVPGELPPAWRFFGLACQGEHAKALRLLAASDDPLATYNRFVLAPDPRRYPELRAWLRGSLGTLLQAAAYALGLEDQVPSAETLDGELRAVVLSLHAAAAWERGEPAEALELLQQAAAEAQEPLPPLAARLLCQWGQWALQQPGTSPQRVAQVLRHALQLASQARLPLLQAQLWLYLGLALHQGAEGHRAALLEAVRCYQKALHSGITRSRHPELYALVQNHLGLAYMAMPAREASDQLRMGIAVQAFREAVRAYDRQKTPQLWASAQMNLANALQYLPSSHPAKNLAQAVEAYEEVLQVRDKALDPVGHARVLLNQANALAHLGQFRRALARASEALVVFRRWELPEEAQAAEELVQQIHHHLAAAGAPAAEPAS